MRSQADPSSTRRGTFLAKKIGLGRTGKNPRNTRGGGRASGGSGPAQAAPEAYRVSARPMIRPLGSRKMVSSARRSARPVIRALGSR